MWLNIERAITELSLEYEIFREAHPENATQIEAMGKALLIVQDMVEDFWRNSWGDLPQDMASWG